MPTAKKEKNKSEKRKNLPQKPTKDTAPKKPQKTTTQKPQKALSKTAQIQAVQGKGKKERKTGGKARRTRN